GADDKVKQLVQQMLSYEVETGDWKGTSTMFNWSKNSFPAGFAIVVGDLLAHMEEMTGESGVDAFVAYAEKISSGEMAA
ncbi:hypothetical protein ACSLNR_28375, partial [Escherichia coli]